MPSSNIDLTKIGQSQLADIQQRVSNGINLRTSADLASQSNTQLTSAINSRLVDSVMTSGPKDTLATVDVYGVTDTSPINLITDKLKGFGDELYGMFRRSSNLLPTLAGVISLGGSGGFSINKSSLTDRVINALGGSGAVLNRMSSSLRDSLTAATGLDPRVYDEAVAVVGGVTMSLQTDRLDDAKGIFELINRVTGQSALAQFFDVGAEANLISGITGELIALGVPDAIDVLIQNAQQSKAAEAALLGNVMGAIQKSDLKTIQLMITKLGTARILSDVPNAAYLILTFYRLPAGTTGSQLDTQLTTLTGILAQLKPGWDTYNRNGVQISSLAPFVYASSDAVMLFQRSSQYKVAATIASTYPSVDLLHKAEQDYPYMLKLL